MEAIITSEDIRTLKPRFSVNIQDAQIVNQMIIDAQRFDVRPILGEAFYYEVYTAANVSPVVSPYTELLNGTTYTNSNGLTVQFYGLKVAIVDYAFARSLENINLYFTRAGAKYKNTDTSERINNSELASWVNSARSQAIAYMNDVNEYLTVNKADFPTWVSDCQDPTGRSVKSYASQKSSTNFRPSKFYTSKKY